MIWSQWMDRVLMAWHGAEGKGIPWSKPQGLSPGGPRAPDVSEEKAAGSAAGVREAELQGQQGQKAEGLY